MSKHAIITDKTPVKVRGEALDDIWWQGRQWAVTSYGIEARDGQYGIEASRLAEMRPDLYGGWPAHMARKPWVDIDDFATAFLVACPLHGKRVARAAIQHAVQVALEAAEARVRYVRQDAQGGSMCVFSAAIVGDDELLKAEGIVRVPVPREGYGALGDVPAARLAVGPEKPGSTEATEWRGVRRRKADGLFVTGDGKLWETQAEAMWHELERHGLALAA